MKQLISALIDKLIYPSVRRTIIDWPLDFGVEMAVMNNVWGDYHEFGVFKGRSFKKVAMRFLNDLSADQAKDMQFWAYDSFEGLPATEDKYAPAHFSKGAFSAPREEFTGNVVAAGVPEDKIKIVPGFYDQSLTADLAKEVFKTRKIAMTYIDCDIYESAVPIFDYITHGLQVGSIIVIDDWVRHHCHPNHGIQRAFHEWMAKNPNIKLQKIALTKRATFAVYEV